MEECAPVLRRLLPLLKYNLKYLFYSLSKIILYTNFSTSRITGRQLKYVFVEEHMSIQPQKTENEEEKELKMAFQKIVENVCKENMQS